MVALGAPGCDTDCTPFLAAWKELLSGSILLLGMFLKYSLASRKLNEMSSKLDKGVFFGQIYQCLMGSRGSSEYQNIPIDRLKFGGWILPIY